MGVGLAVSSSVRRGVLNDGLVEVTRPYDQATLNLLKGAPGALNPSGVRRVLADAALPGRARSVSRRRRPPAPIMSFPLASSSVAIVVNLTGASDPNCAQSALNLSTTTLSRLLGGTILDVKRPSDPRRQPAAASRIRQLHDPRHARPPSRQGRDDPNAQELPQEHRSRRLLTPAPDAYGPPARRSTRQHPHRDRRPGSSERWRGMFEAGGQLRDNHCRRKLEPHMAWS